jgi:uncharacterized protein YqeY
LLADVHGKDLEFQNIKLMPLQDQLQKDLVAAMKGREEARLSALRMIKTALQKATADSPKPLDDAAEQQILKGLVKQRIDAAEMFRKAGREEQARKEEAEKTIIESYLPAAATPEEIVSAIQAAVVDVTEALGQPPTAKQMGQVIKAAQAKLAGKTVDGRLVSEKVKEALK